LSPDREHTATNVRKKRRKTDAGSSKEKNEGVLAREGSPGSRERGGRGVMRRKEESTAKANDHEQGKYAER
jgi:hypothetical protein